MPARNSSIAPEPAFDPVAQTDQAKAEGDQRHGRGISGPGEDGDEACQFGKLAVLGQEQRDQCRSARQQAPPTR